MASMAPKPPQFFAGMFDVGRDPDWERVAHAMDLLRASGVRIVASSAVVDDDGRARVPFFAKSDAVAEVFGGGGDPKPTIEALSPYRLAAYAKVDPRRAGNHTLAALAKLGDDNVARDRVRPADLEPHTVGCLAAGSGKTDAFAGLIGLEPQRRMLEKIGILVAKHGRRSVECLHMAFVGAPGTGKTELARRMLAWLDAAGVTDGNGTFVKATTADLVGLYVGHTPARTRSVVERALGGMLFIDEAYGLLSAGDYGQEAIDTLVEMLEAERDRLVCVVAGYPHEIEELFGRNPGLRDRFGFRVAFEDYGVADLARIFGVFAAARGYALHPGVSPTLEGCLEEMRGMRGFANARSVRRLFDRAIIECACRCDEKLLTAADVRAAWAQPDLGGSARTSRVGFGR